MNNNICCHITTYENAFETKNFINSYILNMF